MRMHADQVDITVTAVARIVAEQCPQWRDLPVRAIRSHGTVNALFRLGDEIVLRFPLVPDRSAKARAELVVEQEHALRIAPCVPLDVPEPLVIGEPSAYYPGPWTAYRWIPGEPVDGHNVTDADALARDLADFARALHDMDTEGRRWAGSGRGGRLQPFDDDVRRVLAESTHLTDSAGLERVWTRCLAADPHDGPDVWVHADLMPGNLLVRDGRLVAVIDLGAVGVGDPAVDLMPAWNLFPSGPRETYRRALDADETAWERGRGWALVQAIFALPYYVDTNPVMAGTARHTLDALLEDAGR